MKGMKMQGKDVFKKILRRMLEDGEFERIEKSMPRHAERVRVFADSLREAEATVSNDMGEGIEGLSIALLLGVLAEEEPICASVLTYMIGFDFEEG